MAGLRTPPNLPAELAESLQACAASWTNEEDFNLARYGTAAAAMDAYAAFHASALRSRKSRQRSLLFVPNQYGLGNRLRAMKSTLLLAMLTGRVFHVRWEEPFPLASLVRPERIDWREPEGAPLPRAVPKRLEPGQPTEAHVLCLPYATAPPGGDCARGQNDLSNADLRAAYASVDTLEVHTFTDLHIFLSTNPHYAALLARLEPSCPKRMGCLYKFLFSPQPVVAQRLNALLMGARDPPVAGAIDTQGTTATVAAEEDGSGASAGFVGVQVRNRLWRIEGMPKHQGGGGGVVGVGGVGGVGSANPFAPPTGARILACMDLWVPPRARVYFTADDDTLYAHARKLWGVRLLADQGGKVFQPWSTGGKVDATTLGADDEAAMVKAFVDWFALQAASRVVYTHQSSFGKTAAESNDAPHVDVNHTRCSQVEAEGHPWQELWEAARTSTITYDTSQVPGARQ